MIALRGGQILRLAKKTDTIIRRSTNPTMELSEKGIKERH